MSVTVLYEMDDGTTYTNKEDVDALWKVSTVRIQFTCPVCDTSREHVDTGQPGRDQTTMCDTCNEQYNLRPLRIPNRPVEDVPLDEQIAYQLESVRHIHPLRDEHYPLVTGMPASIKYAFFGLAPVGIQYIATGIIYVLIKDQLFTDFLITVSFFSILATTLLASYSFYRSVLRIVLYSAYIYYTEDIQCSFREYLYYVGNYAHIDPFGFKTR